MVRWTLLKMSGVNKDVLCLQTGTLEATLRIEWKAKWVGGCRSGSETSRHLVSMFGSSEVQERTGLAGRVVSLGPALCSPWFCFCIFGLFRFPNEKRLRVRGARRWLCVWEDCCL